MKIFIDSAVLADIEEFDDDRDICGFTTNPTLFRQAGVENAEAHAKEIVRLTEKPISIDGPPEKVWALGDNTIPKVVGQSAYGNRPHGRSVNYTAVVRPADVPLMHSTADIVSVFAGRIMDTGRTPKPVIDRALSGGAQVLWASTREPYNYVQAYKLGCHIITMPPAIYRKYREWKAKPLVDVAAETLAQFDADRAGSW